MPKGGARPGAGRKRGSVSKAKLDLAERAKEYADEMLATLHQIAVSGESEPARVTAACALLDRGYGKPRQSVEMTGKDGGPIEHSVVNDAERFTSAVAGLAARGSEGEMAEPTQH
jgi:hypothetical protein